jgi:hypothetical protein
LEAYNSTTMASNFGKNILLLNSSINTIDLTSVTAQNGTFINFINYSGIEYDIITNGPASNYLINKTLLSVFYTTNNSLNRWVVPLYYNI